MLNTNEYNREYYRRHRAKRLASAKAWQKRNVEQIKNAVKKRAQAKLAFLRALKDRPCQDCGIKYSPWVMDFDHRDPAIKRFVLAHSTYHYSLNDIKIEAAKCDVVCSNCHRERTHKKKCLDF